jgi:hypothetical protein
MAVVTRYFSTTSAGAADGTTWADRAELDPAGAWSTVITGFAFNGSDSLKCLVGPGTYTVTAALASGSFTNPPTVANPLVFAACDSSGVAIAPPDPDWVSAQADFSDATLPVIATTTNIATTSLATAWWYLIKFTASGRNGAVVTAGLGLTWCQVVNSTANTSAQGATSLRLTNCVVKCTGASYDAIVQISSSVQPLYNVRIEGVAGSSGDRRGLESTAGVVVTGTLLTVVNCGGAGVINSSSSTAASMRLFRSVIANNAGDGIIANSTASQTDNYEVSDCMITGNGVYGFNGNSDAARALIRHSRFRDNTSGNITAIGNYPTDLGNYTTDSDDATEYVSVGSGDFRIKAGSAIHGQGYGVADEPSAGGGGGMVRHPGMSGGMHG